MDEVCFCVPAAICIVMADDARRRFWFRAAVRAAERRRGKKETSFLSSNKKSGGLLNDKPTKNFHPTVMRQREKKINKYKAQSGWRGGLSQT